MPNTLSGLTPNEKLAGFMAAFAALLAEYDITELATINDGKERPLGEMRAHKGEEANAPNFEVAARDDAPQYLTLTVPLPGDQFPVRFAGAEYTGNRGQLQFNMYRVLPTTWQPKDGVTTASTKGNKPEKRTALSADKIKGALTGSDHVTHANPAK